VQPLFFANKYRLLVGRQVELEDRKRLAKTRSGTRDDPVQAQLVSRLADPLAARVLTDWTNEILGREAHGLSVLLDSKIEDSRKRNLNR
jgi:hypothetical protein